MSYQLAFTQSPDTRRTITPTSEWCLLTSAQHHPWGCKLHTRVKQVEQLKVPQNCRHWEHMLVITTGNWGRVKVKFCVQTLVNLSRGAIESVLTGNITNTMGQQGATGDKNPDLNTTGTHLQGISNIPSLLLSGKGYRSIPCHTTRLQNRFIPQAVNAISHHQRCHFLQHMHKRLGHTFVFKPLCFENANKSTLCCWQDVF